MAKITALTRFAMEPPFRLLVRAAMHYLPVSVQTRAFWQVSRRPAYLIGILAAAEQARRQGVEAISVVEFGVAGGNGLVAMQEEAEAVEHATGVSIKVFGFDNGPDGLPDFIGDYRDHPDLWKPGDYAMDVPALTARLAPRTTLVLGNVRDTAPTFYRQYTPPPVGFVSFDLDLYSSTRDALQILGASDARLLWHVPVYFDDIGFIANHGRAGELLALQEFNEGHGDVFIDRWYGLTSDRPFPERAFLERMYVCHDLKAISSAALKRPAAKLALR